MITRKILPRLHESLAQFPAVAMLGPRQVGKTTLARGFARTDAFSNMHMESSADIAKAHNADSYLAMDQFSSRKPSGWGMQRRNGLRWVNFARV